MSFFESSESRLFMPSVFEGMGLPLSALSWSSTSEPMLFIRRQALGSAETRLWATLIAQHGPA